MFSIEITKEELGYLRLLLDLAALDLSNNENEKEKKVIIPRFLV
jgi:hypothetical protein